jgi:hypothetical protein
MKKNQKRKISRHCPFNCVIIFPELHDQKNAGSIASILPYMTGIANLILAHMHMGETTGCFYVSFALFYSSQNRPPIHYQTYIDT